MLAVTNAAGTADDAVYTYDSFGTTLTAAGSNPTLNPYRFQSGLFDGTTGLYKFGTRYINPALGRWTQQDPSGAEDYSFTRSNPVNLVDPSGEFSAGIEFEVCVPFAKGGFF